ncbi:hypothetical protein FHP29_16495, partial [Nocardioides albidus]
MRLFLRAGALGVAGLALAAGTLTLPAAAAEPDPPGLTTAEKLVMAEDPSVRATDDGRLYIVDEWQPPTGAAAGSTAEAAVSAGVAEALTETASIDTFALHSRPGALRTIHLDFDGGSLLGLNLWVLGLSLNGLVFGGWSIDTSTGTFSDAEQAIIRETWARVSEDFSAWDVDVTTAEPLLGALWRASTNDPSYGMRVAFTNDGKLQSQLCGGGCGGIAYIDTFDDVTSGERGGPAWVFPSSLSQKAKNMADAAAHEVGHTLGLLHDGTASSAYYGGNTLWGPIMGSPYGAALTQWSKGDYPGATNKEDDLALIGSGGLPLRVDEAGSTPATAAALTTLPDGAGVISGPADSDWYALTECSGALTASVSPAAVGPDLDVALELRDASGGVIASNAPATIRASATGPISGLGASLSVPLSGGPYYLAVSGAGSGSGGVSGWASGGYDRYGSIGTYRLLMSGCAGGSGVPVPPPTEVPFDPSGDPDPVPVPPLTSLPGRPRTPALTNGARGGRITIGARWSTPPTGGGTITGYVLKVFRLDARGRVVSRTRTAVLPGTVTAADVVLPRKGRWAVRVQARNDLGWGSF